MMGDNYYPAGIEDWIQCYETYDEAMNDVGSKTNGFETLFYYKPYGSKHTNDWYDIVDLREWMNK